LRMLRGHSAAHRRSHAGGKIRALGAGCCIAISPCGRLAARPRSAIRRVRAGTSLPYGGPFSAPLPRDPGWPPNPAAKVLFTVTAHNRRPRFTYQTGEPLEAGLALTGREVKSRRGGKATIAEASADPRGGEIWLVNANIPKYLQGGRFNHAPKRVRKLLLHRRQIHKRIGAVEREGMAPAALTRYFNDEGPAKLAPAPPRRKKLHHKRAPE